MRWRPQSQRGADVLCMSVYVCLGAGGGGASKDIHTLSNDTQFILRGVCTTKVHFAFWYIYWILTVTKADSNRISEVKLQRAQICV